uniref:CSON007264 protein n=1 Tax=Culicoides sonorensis TaxID=179676 RepID=A0A336LDK2_CULSO
MQKTKKNLYFIRYTETWRHHIVSIKSKSCLMTTTLNPFKDAFGKITHDVHSMKHNHDADDDDDDSDEAAELYGTCFQCDAYDRNIAFFRWLPTRMKNATILCIINFGGVKSKKCFKSLTKYKNLRRYVN